MPPPLRGIPISSIMYKKFRPAIDKRGGILYNPLV